MATSPLRRVPWVDGTTRMVPEGTAVLLEEGRVVFVCDDGFIFAKGSSRGRSWSRDSGFIRAAGVLEPSKDTPPLESETWRWALVALDNCRSRRVVQVTDTQYRYGPDTDVKANVYAREGAPGGLWVVKYLPELDGLPL